MINVDLKPLLKGGISRYSLCVAVAKLSREINDEAIERKERDKVLLEEKPVSLAVEEIMAGEYEIKESEEIKKF